MEEHVFFIFEMAHRGPFQKQTKQNKTTPPPPPPKNIPPKVTSLKHFGILGKKENSLKAVGEREKETHRERSNTKYQESE